MKRLIKKADKIIDRNLDEKLSWGSAFLIFSCYGSFLVFYMVQDKLLIQDASFQPLFVKTMSFLTFGIIYGVPVSLLLSVVIANLYKLFKVNVKVKSVIIILKTAYKPAILIVLILLLRLTLANYYDSSFVQDNLYLIVLATLILTITTAILSIWMLILLFRGLKKLSSLETIKNVMVYFGSALILSPINLILLN